jgi:hypothetical protein
MWHIPGLCPLDVLTDTIFQAIIIVVIIIIIIIIITLKL